VRHSVVWIAVVVACGGRTRQPPTTTVVERVIETPNCELTPLPVPARIVGFPVDAPANLSLAITKSDAAELRRELDGLRVWATDLMTCLAHRQ